MTLFTLALCLKESERAFTHLFHQYFPDEELWSGKWYGVFIQKFKIGILSAQPCGGQAQPLWISSFLFYRESQELDGLLQLSQSLRES